MTKSKIDFTKLVNEINNNKERKFGLIIDHSSPAIERSIPSLGMMLSLDCNNRRGNEFTFNSESIVEISGNTITVGWNDDFDVKLDQNNIREVK